MKATKAQIHEMVDRLPESELAAIERVLDDPLLRALLSTSAYEESLTREEISGILEAKRDGREGRVQRFARVEGLIRDLNADDQR